MQNTQFYPSAIESADCVKNGWNLVSQDMGLYVGISFVGFLLLACIPCVNIFIAGPITCGIYYCFLRGIRGEGVEFGMMFKGFERFVPAMLIGLIAAIPEIIAQVLRLTVQLGEIGVKQGRGNGNFFQADGVDVALAGLSVVVIIVGLVAFFLSIALRISLFFALLLLAEHDMTTMEAIKLSFSAAWANLGGLILLIILEALVILLGVLALCVGIFVAMPVVYAANAFAYRQVFPDMTSNFQNVPPPPTSYGGGAYGTAQ